jgi:hypothetical protein
MAVEKLETSEFQMSFGKMSLPPLNKVLLAMSGMLEITIFTCVLKCNLKQMSKLCDRHYGGGVGFSNVG